MTPLYSPAGQRRLDDIVKPGLLCVFDFDGTLAPIVADPEAAALPKEILRRLQSLAQFAPVGILTGRGVEDAQGRIGFAADFIVGNHGIEGMPGWERRAERYRSVCRGWREAINTIIANEEWRDAGLMMEDKGYSLSMHYRLASDQARTAARLSALFADLSPLPRVIAGKCVFNLLPDDAADKGSALEQLIELSGARTALYVGDDVTDEDAFRLHRPDLLSIRVEALADSAADFYLERPADIGRFLDDLRERLQAAGARNWRQPQTADNG